MRVVGMAVAVLVSSAGCSRTSLDDGDYPMTADGSIDAARSVDADSALDATDAQQILPCLVGVAQVSAAAHHTCARKTDGTLWCWGYNGGLLGDGTSQEKIAFAQVSSLGTTVAVSAGLDHTCALESDRTLWCWGENSFGQLGDGTTVRKYSPVEVAALGANVAQVSVGFENTCARKSDGTAWCWGGLLGNGTGKSPTPLQITPLGTGVEELSTGSNHTCVVVTGNSAWCWGANTFGQLGDGSIYPSATPVQVQMEAAVSVSAGNGTTCALKVDGTPWCWGFPLGGTSSNQTHLPAQVTALGNSVAAVSVGASHACARMTDGTLWCWGNNGSGELGDGTTTSSLTPVEVTALGTSVAEVSCGQSHTCARKTDGTLWCWGSNWYGQLGDGTTNDRHLPVRVGGACP